MSSSAIENNKKISWFTGVLKNKKRTRNPVFSGGFSSLSQIWKSKLSWRIAFAVFLTIMAVEASILALNLKEQEQKQLETLTETAKSAIVPLLHNRVLNPLAPPFPESAERRLIANTVIDGIAIYSTNFQLIRFAGEPVATVLSPAKSLQRTYRSPDGNSYEIIFRPKDLNSYAYYIVARINASSVSRNLNLHVRHAILIMLLMSGFVTTVLMIALGYWLLEPVLFLRNNLLSASANPENPNIPDSTFDPSDEIGNAIYVAQNLIRQNANNIRQIKSTAQDQIHKLAYYDTLTGLPNRTLFLQKLAEFLRKTTEDGQEIQRYAVVTLDLDHFKDINDSMGHNIGDAILRAVGKRLVSALPENAIVARSGEDEFAITSPLVADVLTSRDIGRKIQSVLRAEPFKVFNENFQVRSSIGVATFPDDAKDPEQVLKCADIALNRAKEEGRDTIREYLEDFDRDVQERFQMLRHLRDAMEKEELRLFYQPQLDLKTGKIIGAEALLRWWRPDNSKEGGAYISPAIFVPIAEQSGLIVPMGAWVMREACTTVKQLTEKGHDIRMAVNVSGAQFHQANFYDFVKNLINELNVPTQKLELEVTESIFMEDIQNTVTVLQKLHGLGLELAIDDFGTGYSSLSYLRQFPIDRLKIDQSFIRNALNDADDASITRTIISLGHSLNLKIIAEGVETREHEDFLIREGCDEVQGFRYSKPVPYEDFVAFVENYNNDLSSFDRDER